LNSLNRHRYRKKLTKTLSKADDEAFCQLVWSVDALQSDRVGPASRYLRYPQEAATSDPTSRYAVFKWDLESLINQLLITPKLPIRPGLNRVLNCESFEAIRAAVNQLRSLEDAEAGIVLRTRGVLSELHRIAQRQFRWQRGYFNVAQFYRYAYIYAQGECGRYFEHTYGLTVNQFPLIGFALHTSFQENPWLSSNFTADKLGITPALMKAGLPLLSAPVDQAHRNAAQLISAANAAREVPLPTAYQPSFLRRYPILAFGRQAERLQAPLPQLIALRVTAGVYYDLVGGGGGLRNEAAKRFESYCFEYLSAMLSELSLSRSQIYGPRGNSFETPDILIQIAGEVAVAIECKATNSHSMRNFLTTRSWKHNGNTKKLRRGCSSFGATSRMSDEALLGRHR
jgi:hypothetical protein